MSCVYNILMGDEFTVRRFKEDDISEIETLKELGILSGDNVEEWIDGGMLYGLFKNNEAIGYLTLGYADACGEEIDNHPAHTLDSRMLSNVFIKKEYRQKGLGLKFIKSVIEETNEAIYLNYLEDSLINYYEKIGFVCIGGNSMFLNKRTEI